MWCIKPLSAGTDFSITFIQRRPNVFDVGPALYKYYTNVLCLLGKDREVYWAHFPGKDDPRTGRAQNVMPVDP